MTYNILREVDHDKGFDLAIEYIKISNGERIPNVLHGLSITMAQMINAYCQTIGGEYRHEILVQLGLHVESQMATGPWRVFEDRVSKK